MNFKIIVMMTSLMQIKVFNLRTTLIIFTFSLISACATVSETYLPSGNKGYNIGCDGSALSWDLCYNKAGEICKSRGYRVIKKSGDKNPIMVPKVDDGWKSTPDTGKWDLQYAGDYVSRSLLIECN